MDYLTVATWWMGIVFNKNMETKICKGCKKEKSLDEFYKNKSSRDGLHHLCKECESKQIIRRRIELRELSLDKKWNEILKKKCKQLDDPVGKKCYELNNCKGPCIATCPIYQALNSPSAFFGEVIDCNLEKVNVLAISLVTEGPIDVVGAIKFVDCGTKTEQVTK